MLVTPIRRESTESNNDDVDVESRITESTLRSKKFTPFSVDSLLFKKGSVEKSLNVEQQNQNVQRTQPEVAELQRGQFCDIDSSKHEESNHQEENTDISDDNTGTDF